LPDGIFQTKNPNLVKFLRDLQLKLASWSILLPFGIFCGKLVYFMVIWYIFPVLVCCTKTNMATLLWDVSLAREKKRLKYFLVTIRATVNLSIRRLFQLV
jgi:hypothetical protein